MIISVDLDDITVGDNLIVTVEVVGVLHKDGKTTLRFKPLNLPTEVTYTGNPTFEASSHPIKVK